MRIGVLASRTGVSAKTIRFYEEAGLLPPPPRTSAGYRDYPEQAASRLSFVKRHLAAVKGRRPLAGIPRRRLRRE